MHLSSTRHLGGTFTAGSSASGSRYASHTTRSPHTYCWMSLAVFPDFPTVPSLSGTMVQTRQDLLASTAGAGSPHETSLLLQIELFDDECPQLCANFRRLCNGESATRQGTVYCHQGLTPSYRGTYFHKIIPAYCAQGGDITMRVVPGGSNSYASAGRGWLPDESKKRRHNEVGLVSMANNGPNSNGSQFFVTTSAANERGFNGRHCCIGRVIGGLDAFLELVAPYGDKEGRPSRYAVVVDCGEGFAPTLSFTASSLAPPTAAAAAAATAEENAVADETHDDEEMAVGNGADAADSTRADTVMVAERVAPTTTPPPQPSSSTPSSSVPPLAETAMAASVSSPLKSSMKRTAAVSAKHVTYQA